MRISPGPKLKTISRYTRLMHVFPRYLHSFSVFSSFPYQWDSSHFGFARLPHFSRIFVCRVSFRRDVTETVNAESIPLRRCWRWNWLNWKCLEMNVMTVFACRNAFILRSVFFFYSIFICCHSRTKRDRGLLFTWLSVGNSDGGKKRNEGKKIARWFCKHIRLEATCAVGRSRLRNVVYQWRRDERICTWFCIGCDSVSNEASIILCSDEADETTMRSPQFIVMWWAFRWLSSDWPWMSAIMTNAAVFFSVFVAVLVCVARSVLDDSVWFSSVAFANAFDVQMMA